MIKKILPFALVILLVVACNKENQTNRNIASDDQISALVDISISAMDSQEVLADDLTQTIYMVNDGIAADFLPDETCMAGNDQGISPEKKFIRDKSFIHCLRELSLSESQLKDIKQDLRAYNSCNKKVLERARIIYKELKEKYHIQYQRLWKAFQNGTITREEIKNQLAKLQIAFKQELRKMHLQEKLDDAFKSCLREFLKALKGVLTERQWNAFAACYKQ